MRVAAYLRVSGKAQVDGDGFPRQEEAIRKFCKANALDAPEIHEEPGVSGTVEGMDRPAFFELLTTLAPGDCIIVERMDRLARSLMVSEIILKECRTRGVKVFSADRGSLVDVASDGADATVVLIRQVLAAVAEFEKSALVKKLKAARDRKRAETGHCDGTIPYGRLAGEAAVLKLMKGILGDYVPVPCVPGGGLPEYGNTYGSVARLLNDGGFSTRKGNDWDRKSVRSIWVNHNKKKETPQ